MGTTNFIQSTTKKKHQFSLFSSLFSQIFLSTSLLSFLSSLLSFRMQRTPFQISFNPQNTQSDIHAYIAVFLVKTFIILIFYFFGWLICLSMLSSVSTLQSIGDLL